MAWISHFPSKLRQAKYFFSKVYSGIYSNQPTEPPTVLFFDENSNYNINLLTQWCFSC